MLRVHQFDMARAIVSGLQAMGLYDAICDGPTGPKRLDAGESATFARELEFIYSEVYRKEYPDMLGRSLVPIKPGPGPGHESHTYTEVTRFGEAKVVHNYATDFPSGEVQGAQVTQSIRSLGDSYQYSVQDLRAAALTKIHMPTEKAEAAREVLERKLDSLILNGDANSGLKGLNSLASNFNSVAKAGGGSYASGTNWTNGANAKEILQDVRALFQSVPQNTKNRHRANTLVLDTASYNYIAYQPVQALDTSGNPIGFSGQTILQFIQANVPGLQSVEVWYQLDTAASGHSRIFAMDRNPQVLYQVLPQDFEQFPPQARNLAFVIPCHMRWGGVVTPYPKAISYMDGTGNG